MTNNNEPFPLILKALCKTCYFKFNEFHIMKSRNNMLMICTKNNCTNTSSIYVSAKDPRSFIRDYQNNSKNCSKTPLLCKYDSCRNYYQKCTFAHNDSEYFVWVRMIDHKEFRISDIFQKYFEPFIYVPSNEQKLSNRAVVLIRNTPINYQLLTVPQNPEENASKQKEENSKIYFCWFCRTNITSERNIKVHLDGKNHQDNYEADKKRKWYFKMPGPHYLSNFCQNNHCSCDYPHSVDELNEMIARIKFRNFFIRKYVNKIPESLISSTKKFALWPDWLQIKIPKFPNRIKCYSNPIQAFVTLTILKCKFKTLHIYLKDDESRPYFQLVNTNDNQNLQYSNQLLTFQNQSGASKCTIKFGVKFKALYCSTYRQNIAFNFISDTNDVSYLKAIRVDVGTTKHLKNLKDKWLKYKTIINCDQVDDHMLTPFEFDENMFTTSILSEEDINNVLSILANDDWINTTVRNHNYMAWMRDMLVMEELEQRIIVSKLNVLTKIKFVEYFVIKDSHNYVCVISEWIMCDGLIANGKHIKTSFKKLGIYKDNLGFFYRTDVNIKNDYLNFSSYKENLKANNGTLYGKFHFLNEQDILAKKLFTENIRKGYFTLTGKNSPKQKFEFEVVNFLDNRIETRSILGATLSISKATVKILNLKKDMELEIHIYFYYDRFSFDKRHKSLNKIPQYDKLSYNPLSCPSFTRLPYGEDQLAVKLHPINSLNTEQIKLPRLVLRKINPNEIPLPFVLNGAFGTGKTLLIAETIGNILNLDSKVRILICTRSASAAGIYMKIFRDNLAKHFHSIKMTGTGQIYERLDDLYVKYRVLVTTLDYAFSWTKFDFRKLPTFGYIFVDEAAQVLEADAIGLFQFGNQHSKFVFAGDIYQTNAEIYNKDLQKFSVPIIRRLYKYYSKVVDYRICLNQVYRTHPKIVKFLSETIYHPLELSSLMNPVYKNISPMKFLNSHNDEYDAQFNESLGSFQNLNEIEIVVSEIRQLINDNKICPKDIMVCSPFYAQVTLMRQKLQKHELAEVHVELPSGIQGKEFQFVFLSTVLTSKSLDQNLVLHPTFHDSKNLINVVISRAKHFVGMVGDEISLLKGDTWKEWQHFIKMTNI